MRAFKKFFFAPVLLAFLCLTATPQARADNVVFSNFGPGMTFSGSALPVGIGSGLVLAQRFTSAGTFTFTSANVPMRFDSGTNQIEVSLATNLNNAPGSIIESITLNNALTFQFSVLTANSILHPLLSAGTDYWLIVRAPTLPAAFLWNQNVIGDNSNGVNMVFNPSNSLGLWAPAGALRGAFQINGEPVPEPTTVLLLVTGLAGIAARVKRRKKKV